MPTRRPWSNAGSSTGPPTARRIFRTTNCASVWSAKPPHSRASATRDPMPAEPRHTQPSPSRLSLFKPAGKFSVQTMTNSGLSLRYPHKIGLGGKPTLTGRPGFPAGFARRGLDAPDARPAALEPSDCPSCAARRPSRTWPRISPDAADAASSRAGDGPSGKPAVPVSRAGDGLAEKPVLP